jgi:hypothetical protein
MERYEDILQLKIHPLYFINCDVNLLSKLSIIFKEWRVKNNVDRGGVIVLFVL